MQPDHAAAMAVTLGTTNPDHAAAMAIALGTMQPDHAAAMADALGSAGPTERRNLGQRLKLSRSKVSRLQLYTKLASE
eukprot:1886486-Pyramimonas_sp.AAC.1